ncbi:PREDICTED: centrosomal protein of 290 kDa [Rhagoletis zephyria]|uniref:centrosomal protein of 290 kDa n=1 Tax=Rhagoletis zephyria TaxID=28612 RepID=UPI0008118208|nr:PREDICTED: centrosomal protein of 290 kDa [Rhagoletis zephyria]
MEISDLVSARKFREFNTKQKEELYETLLQLIVAIEEIPKKSLRRTLDVTLAVLQYKGEQVADLQSRLEDKESSEDRLVDENEKLKVMLERLEDEKLELKDKVKELTEDIFQLQKRMQEAAQTAAAEGSDKDSSDPLSELDKQEDLLRNINSKNKHIKRLLREIEALQNQNIAQSKTIIECETELQQSKTRLLQLSADITLVDSERKALKETVNELSIEITRLEGNITYLEEEREKSEHDLKSFIEKLETKAQSWKNMLDAKDKEVKKLRARLEKMGEPISFPESLTQAENDGAGKNATASDDEEETTKLLHALESRDKHIESLELKIKYLAEEMMSSTRLMNQLSAEKEEARNPNKTRTCCKTIEESLQAANERCRELSEMLERSEEDNALKSKQAMHAISALEAYQRGEDGLVKALRKCTALEQKVISRDKQIRALIMELNSMHEIAHENGILRKRLNIPDDMVISAKNLVAKERNKDKMIERLTLKLRASEEMRLQLKLEKSDLRKELLERQKLSQNPVAAPTVEEERATMDSLRIPSEIGEVTESGNASHAERNAVLNFCANCKLSLEIPDEANQAVAANQLKYQDVLDENDTLRAGMLEILEKLREYNASSDHITIDTEMLYRLLEALRTSSIPSTPKRLQSELHSLKAREEALRALIKQQPHPAQDQEYEQETDELSSVESMRDGTKLRNGFDDELSLHIPKAMDSSTRPTTPNKNIKQQELPVILPNDGKSTFDVEKRELQLQVAELNIYRQGFEDLQQQLKVSDAELTQSYVDLNAKLVNAQLELNKEKSSYAFMRVEFDNTLNEVKQSELRHIEQMTALQKELATLKDKLSYLEKDCSQLQNSGYYSKEDFLQMQATNSDLRAQLAAIIEQLFADKLDTDLKIPDICADYGIINENMQLDYLTMDEYRELQATLKEAQQQLDESLRKSAQLESLLEIAQSQIQSQQKLLNEITDNHVNLRHLVADLQSNTEEKLLLAKMQRELDSAKQEVSNLRFEFDQLKQKCAALERDSDAKDQKLIQLTKGFQLERSTKDIKIKFLQKSMYVLREKYAKFTPLIFLTNFVFAYTKFVKKSLRSTDNGRGINELSETIKESIIANLKNENIAVDESQNLIELIKSETQCKLLERNLQELQHKYDSLHEELLEQRILSAKETGHWQTIEALFGNGAKDNNRAITEGENKVKETDTKKEEQYPSPRQKDVATNTDAPVPAERKLSATPVLKRRSTVEMLDKNLSPIGSPIRRIRKADATTQTTIERSETHSVEVRDGNTKTSDQPKSTDKVALSLAARQSIQEPDKTSEESTKGIKLMDQLLNRETNDAIVQTAGELTECQSVQTEALAVGEPQLRDEVRSTELEERIKEMGQKLSERDIRLEESKTELITATKRIEELQSQLELVKSSSETKTAAQADTSPKSDIIEKTILSFHTLLSEKDKSISKYQDLLQTEREQIQNTTAKLNNEIGDLKSTITNLNFNIKTKDMEILELKTQLEIASVRRHSAEKLELATGASGGGGGDESGDNSLNELTDEKIEEMFQQDPVQSGRETTNAADGGEQLEKQDTESMKELPTLLKQVKELKDKASYWEKTLAVKEEELSLLKEKVNLYEEREKSMESAVNPEMEQLRQLLEEKDKHINELTETLNNFHDDQQRYFKDSSSYSADQISKLHADLTRTEATNKIYHTQVDALRRQIDSLTQREKQARELNQSLRNQLIKRPVVSIKTELNARVKTENLQKRIHSLELELEEARAQIQRQQIVLDAKRAKSASEVGLWEKQKRWQQNAEKFKAKFEEADGALEKTRALLQSARTMIARLEKEKQMLEMKLGRAGQCGAMQAMKCCRTPSCPNLQRGGGKYTPSESPETYTGASSECSSPAHSASERHKHMLTHFCAASGGSGNVCGAAEKHQPHAELIEALKARIELQQRKILAMELEGKGSNALTTEMEKLQEKLSEIEAQNIRLEAKNLQLQLDNDLMRQGDATERLEKRIKYLEDYIIALKEEMAQAEARRDLCKCSGIKLNTQLGHSAEQTILSLRGIVEKLRAENKFLKDGRRACESRNINETTNADVSKLQKLYAESLDKIAFLQVELNGKTKCRACGRADTHVNDEMSFIKEQLSKKTQLLQKAKVLLTRAAAKEKVLKEQLLLWKRKCSELQNVPVIDEISE